MSILDTVYSLATDEPKGYYVRRYLAPAFVNGIEQAPVLAKRFRITAVLQPATGFDRVTAGMDLHSDHTGQHTVDARLLYTDTEIHTLTARAPADVVEYDGSDWFVFRVLPYELSGDRAYEVVITRLNGGAS